MPECQPGPALDNIKCILFTKLKIAARLGASGWGGSWLLITNIVVTVETRRLW